MGKGERIAWGVLGALVVGSFVWSGTEGGSSALGDRAQPRAMSTDASPAAGEGSDAKSARGLGSALQGGTDGPDALAQALHGWMDALLPEVSAAGSGARIPRTAALDASDAPKDYSYSNRDPEFASLPPELFDPRDLAVLEDIIALNGLDESASEFDYDNADGVFDPRELGDQRWCNGRLRELRLGPGSYASFGYQVRQLPESIADLDGLLILEANAVGLEEVPRGVSQLPRLRRVSLYNNAIQELPPELADARRLEEIQVTGNPIRAVPDEVANGSLQRLFVDMERLEELPTMLLRQQEATMSGTLEVPPRDLGPLGRNCLPVS